MEGPLADMPAKAQGGSADAVVAGAAEVVLVSAVKNEAPFLLEWIAYDKAIGFSRIIILSNTSVDGTEDILSALAANGEIDHYHVEPTPKQSPQGAALKVFEAKEGYRDGSWYLWLDADEFLNIHVGERRVTDLIKAVDGHEAVFLNWRIFGTSGHERHTGRYVSADYPGASRLKFSSNREIKVLFRKSPKLRGFHPRPPYRPLLAKNHGLSAGNFLVGTGKPPRATGNVTTDWLGGGMAIRTNIVAPSEVGWALAQINHYSVRTPEFFKLKNERGRGAARTLRKTNDRHTTAFFKSHNRNDETDLTIAAWEEPTAQGIERLSGHPAVAEALALSAELVRRQLQRSAETDASEMDAQSGTTSGTVAATTGQKDGDLNTMPDKTITSPQAPARPVKTVKPVVTAPAEAGTRKVLFSAMKNEAPFILEWVAYHKAIGFDDIVICSNPSNDGTEEVLAALAKAGHITHLHVSVPEGASPQFVATQAFESGIGLRNGDWYMWLDADEFLNVHVGDGTVAALIDAMGDKQIALINWRIFGSSGQTAFHGRFIDPAFTGAAEPDFPRNNALKTFFRHSPAIRGFARHGIHRPRIARLSKLTLEDVLVGNGKTPAPDNKVHARWLRGKDTVFTNQVTPAEAGWALAQVNHYIVRTREVYELKRSRGRGYVPKGGVGSTVRHNAEFFAQHDRNEAEDRTILRWQDAVTAGIAGFMKQRAIATAVRAADRKSKAELAAALARPPEPPAPVPAKVTAPAAPVRRKLAEDEAPRRVLFSAMKNEAPFLLEWVAYHKAIGFDDIVICSNPSNDGTEELLAALAQAGEITHLQATVPKGASPQYMATQAFERDVGFRDGDWYLWLDADEFLNVHVGDRNVGALIDAMGDKQIALINWRIFGSSGNKAFPGRFVDPAFTGAAEPMFPLNFALKAIFRCSPAIRGFARHGIHRPRIARNSGLGAGDVLLGSGKTPAIAHKIHRRWLDGDDIVRTSRVSPSEFGWTLAQINHYIVRTEDYFILKALRGRGYMPRQKVKTNNRHTPEFFAEHDRNEAEDRTILHWQQPVSDEIARLTQVPAIAEAAALATTKVEQIMAQLNEPDVAPPEPKPKATASTSDFKLTFPAAERRFVTEAYAKAGTVLEYGSGGSTVLAAKAGARVVAVESDKAWAARLAETLAGLTDKADIHHVDIGPTADWGKPKTTEAFARFPNYALSVWDRPDLGDPDLVLIDGRFRAACFAAVVMRARQQTTVLFDDYIDRKYYHAVEKLAVKEQVVGRMARFTVTPGPIPPEMLTQVIGWFSDPR